MTDTSQPHGAFALERCSGLLPPLRGVGKEIAADGRGFTRVGPLALPFRLEPAEGGYRLRYRFPLSFLADDLRPEPDGTWRGRARAAGLAYGSFRMRPRCSETT